jgi:hypothetical protein
MVYDPTLFNTNPYYDDFNEDKKFLRMLFNPGKAVQARELTQLQTVIQNQVQRFGDHILNNGSRVVGGEISNQDVSFIRFQKDSPAYGATGEIDVTNFYGTDLVIDSGTSDDTRRAKVLHGITSDMSTNDDYYILCVQYISGGSGGAEQFADAEVVKGICGSNVYKARIADRNNVDSTDALNYDGVTGTAKLTTINDGVFFVDGFFVKNDIQSVSPYGLTGESLNIRNFSSPTSRIGFTTEKTIISATDDYTLRDPASGAYNFNAPGADRYKIDLKVDFKNFENHATAGSTAFGDLNFFEIVRFVNGAVQLKKQYSDYSEIEKTLARRTHDESGSYTVKPFEINLRESLDTLGGVYSEGAGGKSGSVAVGLESGKAYVFGYELETQGTQYILVDKGRSADSVASQPMGSVKFGQYVKVKGGITPGGKGTSSGIGMSGALTGGFPISDYPKIRLQDPSGATGTARVRMFEQLNDWGSYGDSMTGDDQTYNMYLFDVQLGGITAFGNVVKFGGGTTLGSGSLTAGFVVATGGTNANGTALFEPSYNSSIFPVPIGNSVNNVSDLTYTILKTFNISQTTASNQINLDSGDNSLSFAAAAYGILNPSEKFSKYLLVCKDGGSLTMGCSGERMLTDSIRFEVPSTSTNTLNIGVGDGTSGLLPIGNYSLTATLNVGSPFLHRTKTFIKTTDEGSTSEHIFGANGNASGLSGSTGSYHITLDHHDIYDIESITDRGDGTSATKLGISGTDLKAAFLLDNGQRDNYYDYGRVYLNPSWGTGGGAMTGDINLLVTYSRFNHSDGVGPFIVNSYNHTTGISFDNIPIYTSPNTGKSYSLRNCIDFRGTVQSDNTINPLGLIPKPSASNALVDYEYHLSRIDKIILTKERQFDVIRGIPSLNPQEPPDRDDAITLYVLTIPAYTYNVGDITSKFVENKRYTMRDIGSIEKRVENLEYYTSLSLLEQETEGRSILDSSGNDIFKNGIMVDAFRGHSVGDVLNSDYVCSIDYENGHCKPPFTSNSLKLEMTSNDSGITMSPAGVVSLAYSVNNSFVWQSLASGNVSVNPFSIPSFMGHVKFNDPFDEWYDQSSEPVVKINTQGENDRWKVNNESSGYGFGTQWNDWEVMWSGRTVTKNDLYNNRGRDYLDAFSTGSTASNIESRIKLAESSAIRSTETQKTNEGRSGIRVRKLPERLEKIVNNKIVDVSVVSYARAKTLTLSVYGMKPYSRIYPFFEGDDVTSYCGVSAGIGASGGEIHTDSEGKVIDAFFSVPASTYRTGERILRFTDSSSNTLSETTTAADGIYYATGISSQREGDLISTRPIVSRRQVVNDESIMRDAFDRERYINTSTNSLWLDPLAQTMTVDRNTYPNGSYIHSLDLFFQSIDENVPVTVEIRPTIGGYPHLSQSLPFSTVSLIPDSSEVRSDYPNEETYTRFTFDSPVYMAPGEYSICVKSSSGSYKLYMAELGQTVLDTGVVISEQPHNGTLFTPQNTGISVPNTNKALKFKLNNCSFTTEGNASFEIPADEYAREVTASSLITDVLKVNSGEYTAKNTSISHNFDLGGLAGESIINNENIYLADPKSMASTVDTNAFKLNSTLTTTDFWVSPVIDSKRLEFISVHNLVNTSTNTSINGELDANAHSSDASLYGDTPGSDNPTLREGAAARYITRRVTLADGFESNNFKVLLAVNKPAEATVQVFIKPLGTEDDTPFEEVAYTQMTEDSTIPDSANDYDFNDTTFSLSSTFDSDIKTFAIKVCMYSSSSTKVPSIRDFRTIALAS